MSKATDLIDFTRASSGTALRKISYGSELVVNGTFDTDTSGWTLPTTATFTWDNGTARFVASGDRNDPAYQAISVTVGKVYSLSFTASSTSGEVGVRIYEDDSYGTSVLEVNDVSDQSYSNSFVATQGTLYIYITESSATDTGAANFDNISVKEVFFDQPDGTLELFNHPTNIPRIEYDASGNVLGLLVEEARTNLILNSDWSNGTASWGLFNGGLATVNSGIAPDNSNNALKLSKLSGSTAGYLRQTINVSNGSTYTLSVYAKKGSWDYLEVGGDAFGFGGDGVFFDLSAGTITGSQPSKITSIGNGWYRCSTTYTATASSISPFFRARISSTSLGDAEGYEYILLWGAQLESGSFPTSYIPTSGSTVTRASDVASIPVSEFGYNQSEGTLLITATPYDASSLSWYASFGSEAANSIQFYTSSSTIRTFIRKDSVDQAAFNSVDGASDNTELSFACSFEKNNVQSILNGGTIASDASAEIPNITSPLKIGTNTVSSGQLNGHIKSIKYYPRALTSTKIQELTS